MHKVLFFTPYDTISFTKLNRGERHPKYEVNSKIVLTL